MSEKEVDVVTCKGSDLLAFEHFINTQEENRVGWDNGFFKIVVDPFISRQTPNSVILDVVIKELKDVQVQRIFQGTAQSIYQCKCTPASANVVEQFKSECCVLSTFGQMTCCSQKLLTGVDHVVAHFFNDIVKTSGSFNHKTFEEEKKNFLLEGAKLRQLYEDNLIQPNNSVSSRSKCLCLDFIPETSSRLTVTQPDSILYGADVVLRNAEPIFITDGFSLSTIKNILNLTHHYYEGLSCPCFYVGTKHSFSTLHSKDASLWNINYLHFGLPKIWIMIPPRATLLLNYHLWRSGLSLGHTSCWNILGHKTVLPSIQWLQERLIPYKLVVQNPGEGIILYPGIPHFNFSTGWNLAESINFATVSWIPEGINAPKCQCMQGQVHLNMTLFIAAFKPEILDSFLRRQFIETDRGLNSVTFFNESIKKLSEMAPESTAGSKHGCANHKANQVIRRNMKKTADSIPLKIHCPAAFCETEYLVANSGALFKHVVNQHRPILEKCKLLDKVLHQLLNAKKL